MRSFIAPIAALLVVASGSSAIAQSGRAPSVLRYVEDRYKHEFVRTRPDVPAARMAALITEHARRHNIDPLYMASLIYHESNFRPRTVSRYGALGLGQVMPLHWRAHGFPIRRWADPATNLELSCRVLAGFRDDIRRSYRYITPNELRHRTAVAYNAGRGTVSRGIYRSRYSIGIMHDFIKYGGR